MGVGRARGRWDNRACLPGVFHLVFGLRRFRLGGQVVMLLGGPQVLANREAQPVGGFTRSLDEGEFGSFVTESFDK